jgi:Asp-tRNA(Asn)/Glu-tRNA(Gln) amidotransferase A subunit family amidase
MTKKWYNYFVSVDPANPEAQTVADIAPASTAAAPTFTQPVADPSVFEQIYQAAEVRTPAHGFTIFKIADMLKSEHIRSLSVEIKRSSVLLALDAAGVKVQEIIEDAVRRDRALDTFELVQQRALDQLEAKKADENKKLQQEADRVLTELRASIQANNDTVAKERERMQTWRLQKQQEERRIAEAVGPFVTENPITTGTQNTEVRTQKPSETPHV